MPTEIRRKDVKTLVDQNRAQLVEVLPREEYEREHLPKAISLPLEEMTAPRTRELKKDQAVIVYGVDYQCDLSARAAWRLESMGFQEVYRYTAGKADWIFSGFETIGTDAAKPRLKQHLQTNVQTCYLRDRMQDVQNRRAGGDICIVLNDRRIVLGIIEGEAWNANPLARVSDVMNPAPRTFRPGADPKEVVRELRKMDMATAIVTTSDGELLGVIRVNQKRSSKPAQAA